MLADDSNETTNCAGVRAKRPSIAVVIAARNVEEYLQETLDSLAHQTDPPDEVIVYDDASTDDTVEIARAIVDGMERWQLLQGDLKVGISGARNRGNAASQSDYIAVLDADDLLTQDAIACYRAFLSENPQADLVYADTKIFWMDPKKAYTQRYPRFHSPKHAIRKILAMPRVPIKHSSVVYRRAAWEELGGYYEELPLKVDIDLFLRFLSCERCVLKLDATTSLHRKHPRQVSTCRSRGIGIYADLIRRFESNRLVGALILALRASAEMTKSILRC